MRSSFLRAAFAALALAACTSVASVAQPPKAKVPMGHPRMGIPHLPGAHIGNIIGNKNSKVYHLPGDKGSLPAEKNRVYFRTESEAIAAGYHAAKKGGKKPVTKMTPTGTSGAAPPITRRHLPK